MSDQTCYVVVDNEGSVMAVFVNEEDAEEFTQDHEDGSEVQGPFDVEEHYNP